MTDLVYVAGVLAFLALTLGARAPVREGPVAMGILEAIGAAAGPGPLRLPAGGAARAGEALVTVNGLLQLVFYFAVLTALAVPLGRYMAAVYEGRAGFAQRVLGPLERLLYRVAGVRPEDDMDWKRYAAAFLIFNGIGILFLYALQRLQGGLPLNAAGLPAVNPEVALNTAVSFGTNTNWQAYGGETTMSHLTQMLGLTVQNFVSAAAGMAVAVALIRGFTRRLAGGIGNFWVDLVRSTLYVLLPLSLIVALVLVWQGVPQTFQAKATVPLLESTTRSGRHAR